MMKQKDNLDPSGHLEIYKVYKDGSEERVFDDHNVITSGMGVGLGLLYAGSGAADITNFQIRYFQLGSSGDSRISTNAWAVTSYGVSETFLASALGQENQADPSVPAERWKDYQTTTESALPLSNHELMAADGGLKKDSQNHILWYFGVISDNNVKRVDLNSVTYILYVDRESCNNIIINEVGLFMDNPLGNGPLPSDKRSQLVAYRPFTNINKTSDFALVFKWTLHF